MMKRRRTTISADEVPALPPRARLTPQRRAIIDAIVRGPTAFTAAELHEKARRTHPRLGLATTYRTLELLRETGGVRRIHPDEGVYTRCRPHHHHHLICLSCGGVEETELCGAPAAAELARRHGFAAERHELEIYGTCARCA